MDVIGVLLVLVISFALGFHKTIRQDLPIGIFSTFGAAGSMMVTRLVTKRNNIGNLIGLLTAVNSAFVDYYLGNDAAFLTYPISFLGAGISYLYWKRRKDRIPRKIDSIYFINIGFAFVLGIALNYIHADTDDDEYEHQRQIGQRDSKQRRQTKTDDLGEHDHYHGAKAQRESGATERCSAQQ